MRTTIKVDSATPEQVYNLTLAFQRTRNVGLPSQITTTPTITVAGTCMGWESPALYPDQAPLLLAEFDELEDEGSRRERETSEIMDLLRPVGHHADRDEADW